jgi:MICOS complex subunit MIC19
LQTSTSRAQSYELHIAERVAAELASLQKKEDDALTSLRETLSSSSSSSPSSSSSSSSTSQPAGLLEILPAPADATARQSTTRQAAQSSARVFEELEKLRKGLDARKQLKEMPVEVERAREGLVACLRLNDRRPLDCWREVEAFKRGVARLEEEFIGKVL